MSRYSPEEEEEEERPFEEIIDDAIEALKDLAYQRLYERHNGDDEKSESKWTPSEGALQKEFEKLVDSYIKNDFKRNEYHLEDSDGIKWYSK
ncbi:MAG: hypothetical protein AABX05_02525 [Nanoarchaeota archaeon]